MFRGGIGMARAANPGRLSQTEGLIGRRERGHAAARLGEVDVVDMGTGPGPAAGEGGPCRAAVYRIIAMAGVAIARCIPDPVHVATPQQARRITIVAMASGTVGRLVGHHTGAVGGLETEA